MDAARRRYRQTIEGREAHREEERARRSRLREKRVGDHGSGVGKMQVIHQNEGEPMGVAAAEVDDETSSVEEECCWVCGIAVQIVVEVSQRELERGWSWRRWRPL